MTHVCFALLIFEGHTLWCPWLTLCSILREQFKGPTWGSISLIPKYILKWDWNGNSGRRSSRNGRICLSFNTYTENIVFSCFSVSEVSGVIVCLIYLVFECFNSRIINSGVKEVLYLWFISSFHFIFAWELMFWVTSCAFAYCSCFHIWLFHIELQ